MDTAAQKKISMSEILIYSFGLLGLQTVIGFMGSYQAQFYNKTMGADLAIIGIIMLVAKLISSFADPYIGNLIDRSKFKSGKLRPWILISAFPFLILSIAIYIVVPFRGVALYIYIFITFLLWSIAMSLADIPSQGMLSMLSPVPEERNSIAGIANIFKSIGPAVPYVVIPVVCILTKSEGGAIGRNEYLISAIFLSLLGCALFSLIYFKNRERVPYKSSNSSMKEMLTILKGNKPLLIILISALLGAIRGAGMPIQIQTAQAIVGDINLFGMQFKGENTVVILGVTSAIASLISMAVVPIMTKKWNEKKVFIGMAIYGFIATLAAYVLYVAGVRSLLSVLIMLFFVGLMYGSHAFLPMVMVADCVDYYEWKTGKRTEGVHYAVLSFSIKISGAIAVAVGLIMAGISGYSADATSYSVYTQNVIYASYVLLPGIGCILAAIPIFSYKLVGKEKQRITTELASRRAQAALAENNGEIQTVINNDINSDSNAVTTDIDDSID